eukprot:14010382-Heterocapsa_arctica.AAC.1
MQWHARLLLVRLDRPASWIVARPDHVVETIDLAIHRVIPMARGSCVPAHVAEQCFLFNPLTEDEMRAMRVKASALAQVMGVAEIRVTRDVVTWKAVVCFLTGYLLDGFWSGADSNA